MSSSQSRSSERVVHQDYIARIRYSNTLPPPPNPPKLLEIPNTGLASGQYTTPGFASRLARDQPLNIEADAELGMPLDLVGMPGIFDGDESSIQAPSQLPAPHPHDRALLRPLSSLGKPKFSDTGVSFLRRTEYISSYTSKSRFDSTTSKSLIDNTGSKKARPARNLDKESPENIKKKVEETFEIAARNLKNKNLARHPTKNNLHLVDAYPLLPDLDAFPDAGGYVTIKFVTNPVPPSTTYDIRVENSLLVPLDPSEEASAAKEAALEAWKQDPDRNPAPDDSIDYDLFLTDSAKTAQRFKRKFDILDNEHESDALYTETSGGGNPCFRYKRTRAYESSITAGGLGPEKYDEVVVALHDGKDGRLQKGAYYYPLVQRTTIRPQRQKNIYKKMGGMQTQQDVDSTDFLEIRVEDPDEEISKKRNEFRDHPFGKEGEDEEEEGEDDDAPAELESGGEEQ